MKLLTLSTLIALMFVGCNNVTESGEEPLIKYKGWVVVQKSRRFYETDSVYKVWLQKDNEIQEKRTVVYWFDKYNVGDTIKKMVDVVYLESKPPARYNDTAGRWDLVLTSHLMVGDGMTQPADDGSYLIIHSDTTFEVHGNLQTVLKDLWQRQADAWDKYFELSDVITKSPQYKNLK